MGMGLRLFNGINSIEAARDRVFTLVGRLQSRSLVFANSDDRNYIRIHDLVRDVSKFIARQEKGALVLEHGVTLEKLQGPSENSIWISVISEEVRELPSSLRFPRLELLRCSNEELQILDNCFEGMVKLRVIDLIFLYPPLLKLPSSLQSHTSLHTLCLRNCRLDDYTAIKDLHSLEILRIGDEYIVELPKEIGHLINLMLLDMSDCKKLKRISPGIISGLTKLEELYLGGLKIDWGVEETEQGGNASLGEFDSLSNLHILHIMIKDSRMLPNTLLFGNLKKYQIQIGDAESYFILNSLKYEKISSISSVALNKNINFLLHKSEALLLMGESTKSLVNELVREASQNIKCLVIRETETPEYLVNAIDSSKAPFLVSTLESLTLYKVNNLQQIVNSPLVSGNFARLENIDVQNCAQIRNLFELSTTVDIVHLEKIKIVACRSMKEVISCEGREEDATNKLQFLKLKTLIIDNVPLVCFCKGANEIIFHQLEELTLKNLEVECIISVPDENPLTSIFPHKVSFPSLKDMTLGGLKNMKEIWCGHGSFSNLSKHLVYLHTLYVYDSNGLTEIVQGPVVAGSLVNLKVLTVRSCNQLRNTFQLPAAVDILHLEELYVLDYGSMEEIISWEGETQDVTSKLQFPELRSLDIIGWAENLKCFCKGANEIEFHQLYNLTLTGVKSVECLISISDETTMKSIFPHKVSFPRLRYMWLTNLRNMKAIWCGQPKGGSFYNLSELHIGHCDSLEYVFSPCMASYLEHLRILYISKCRNLKEVIAIKIEVDVQKEEDYVSSNILPKLESVILGKLHALKRFCHIADDLEFPELNDVRILDCPEFETFAPGFVHTPNLNHVNFRWNCEEETLWKGNLNSTIQHLHEKIRYHFKLSSTIVIVHLEEINIDRRQRGMKEVIRWEGIEEDATRTLQLPKLKVLKIDDVPLECFCKGANEIIFHQLEELTLKSLKVECIISVPDENPLTSIFPHKVSFPRLKNMELLLLKNMKAIWCGQPKGGSFYNLSELHIWNCDSLEYVFSPCMASYLVHLQKLEIEECRSLKEVVAIKKELDGQKEEDYISSSILPKLEYVELIRLNALERFCHITDNLEFPELNNVRVVDCTGFETFAPGFVHTPNLSHVNLNFYSEKETLWKGNLNSTIQHLHEEEQRKKEEVEEEGEGEEEGLSQ